jgi:periplasmic protein TonB
MNANYSNTSMLDMVFERRNKAYGAYVLRRDYNKSLQQAMLSILSVVTLFCFGNFIRENMHSKSKFIGEKTVVANTTDVGKVAPPPKKIEPPVPPKHTAMAIATARDPEKRVVRDSQAPADSIPATRDIANVESGLKDNTTAAPGIGATDGDGKERVFEVARETQPAPPTVFAFVEVMPEFPGGDKALMSFIAHNVDYPQMERDNGIQGKVLTAFTVNEDGSISDIQIMRSPSIGFNKEVTRVLKKMPAFKPGMQAGRAVKVRFNLPVAFTLKD